jgi:hypothetical protein
MSCVRSNLTSSVAATGSVAATSTGLAAALSSSVLWFAARSEVTSSLALLMVLGAGLRGLVSVLGGEGAGRSGSLALSWPSCGERADVAERSVDVGEGERHGTAIGDAMVSGWEVDGRSSETGEGEGERHGSAMRGQLELELCGDWCPCETGDREGERLLGEGERGDGRARRWRSLALDRWFPGDCAFPLSRLVVTTGLSSSDMAAGTERERLCASGERVGGGSAGAVTS